MNLLAKITATGHITDAVAHFNHALDLKGRCSSSVDVARSMFDGLNKLQTEWLMNQPEQKIGEVKAFQTMILNGLRPEARSAFLRSTQTQNLVSLDPKIMNHDILKRRGYRPDLLIDPHLAKDACEVHRKLETAFRDFEKEDVDEVQKRVIKRLAELLYVVRSNIAHGEKTSHGPDLAKRKRDEQVCISVVPLQELLFDALLDRPSERLISYGTLAPGQSNHQLVADLRGHWEECVIRGSVHLDQDLSTFSWNPNGSEQKASLLMSDDLPMQWHRIDKFEGERYRRRLVLAKTQAGMTIAYVYLTN